MMLTSFSGCAIAFVAYFFALGTGNIWIIFVASFVFMALLYSGFNGVWPGYFGELFATPIRYTGMSMGNQLGLVVAGFGPTIAGALMGAGEFGWVPVAIFGAVCSLIAIVACLTARETAHTPIHRLGEPYWRAVGKWDEEESVILVEGGNSGDDEENVADLVEGRAPRS